MMEKVLLLGDEAIALGALSAGISGCYAYPGTPSTEIMEYIQQSPLAEKGRVHREWSTNEKTAMEEALGMSYAGKRTLVCMKHVGLNVAADPFVNSAITGVNGGLVVLVADDPQMHSSQNEQDTRYYARFAHIPLLEPSSQQEAYDMMGYAFDLSEKVKLPVLVRVTTRLAHSRADLLPTEPRPQNSLSIPENSRQFILLPANARENFKKLLVTEKEITEASNQSIYNSYEEAAGTSKKGIIASGIAGNYVREVLGGRSSEYDVLYIREYPLPARLVKKIFNRNTSVLLVEEGGPFIEEMLTGPLMDSLSVHGRLDGTLPRTGELTPELVAKALDIEMPFMNPEIKTLRPRPPQLCKGCPHIDSYNFLNEVVHNHEGSRVFSDIGCYTLGALPPYSAIHTCVDMGASITMAKGASDAGIAHAIAVIGDSTFTHSGMTGLLDAVYENTNVTVIILDNETTGMTGQQISMATGRLEQIAAGLGVDPAHIRIVIPLPKQHADNVKVLEEELAYDGVSVIIARRACVHLKRKM